MARVRFTANFDFKPTPQITVGYLSGWSGTVRRLCADQAVAAGAAIDLGRKTDGVVYQKSGAASEEA